MPVIRDMREADCQEVADLCGEIFPSPWRTEDFVHAVNEEPFAAFYVMEDDGDILGYVGLYLLYDQATIASLGVKKDKQRNGYGRALMDYAMDIVWDDDACEKCTLEVRQSNEAAIALYKSLGFEHVSVRKNYYRTADNGWEDAWLMICERSDD